jgi:rare lipoprotein A
MSSISCTRTSYFDIKANHIHPNAALVPAAGVRNVIQLFAVALAAASLAACAQSSVVTSRRASLEHNRKPSFETNRRVTPSSRIAWKISFASTRRIQTFVPAMAAMVRAGRALTS